VATHDTLTNAEITGLLEAYRHGDAAAGEQLLPVVYQTLHDIASHQLANERPDHTLQPTILLHDAWLRLTTNRETPWRDRNHFFALASRAMRRLLVDHARARRAGKRRGDLAGALPDHIVAPTAPDQIDLIALDEALDALASVDDRARRVVEMRFFGALEWPEIASAMGLSEPTVKRDWRFARAWLRRYIEGPAPSTDDPSAGHSPPQQA
jgi:RNA polymerase sigma factor (TIGR02999 family)